MLKSWLGSGRSRARRELLDLHFGARTSMWSEVAARSHLIVAAVGTVALLGLAGTAIWLALPSEVEDQIVGPAEAAPSIEVAEVGPSIEVAEVAAAEPEPIVQDFAGNTVKRPTDLVPARSVPVEILFAEEPAKAIVETDVDPLDPTDPRWMGGAAHGAARKMASHPLAQQISYSNSDSADVTSAYADEGAADDAVTAAIPTAKPLLDDAVEEPAKQKAEGRPGRAVRAVTMRARPSSKGGPLGTVPAKASVQVVSCDSWCEIIYKGKRGFVYKRFLANNGR